MTSAASTAFNALYNKIDKVIPFSESWYNGTGYLDNAVKEVTLQVGERAKTETTGDGVFKRRVILIGTPVGTAVFFERYLPEKDGTRCGTIVNNVPRQLNGFVASGAVSEQDIVNFIGEDYRNIGHAVDNIFKAGVASANK